MQLINGNESKPVSKFGQDIYTDLNQLKNINTLANEDQDAALKKMAQQFEGLFIQMMLKTMREANSVFATEQSSEMNFHQTMYDNQLALNLSGDRGIGLADAFYQQMLAQYSESKVADRLETKLREDLPSETPVVNTSKLDNEPVPNDPSSFVKALYPHAQRVAQKLGVNPNVLIAQSALETGWGKHIISDKQGHSSYNLFNIKADARWAGDKVNTQTVEIRNGLAQKEQANFRRYQNISSSFSDYAQFILTEPRYHDARQANNDQDYIRALQKSGYATDPHYADKIIDLLDHEEIKKASSNRNWLRLD